MSDELIPHVDEDGSTFFECELLAEAVSSASELEVLRKHFFLILDYHWKGSAATTNPAWKTGIRISLRGTASSADYI